MSANEGFLRALTSGLDRLQAASTETINRPLTPVKPVQVLDSGHRKLPTAAISQYLLTGGTACPNCLSTDIVGGHVEVDHGGAWQEISCSACGLEWDDAYQLVAIRRVKFAPESTTGGPPIEQNS